VRYEFVKSVNLHFPQCLEHLLANFVEEILRACNCFQYFIHKLLVVYVQSSYSLDLPNDILLAQ